MRAARVALLIAAVLALGAGRNVAPRPLDVVLIMADDASIEHYPSHDALGPGPNVEQFELGALDPLSSTGFVGIARTTPQCNTTRGTLMALTAQPQSWLQNFAGEISAGTWTLADAIRQAAPDVALGHFGKPGWGIYDGVCTTDGSACYDDGDCPGGTCDYSWATSPQARGGFDVAQGTHQQNPGNFCSWTHRAQTRTDETTFATVDTGGVTTYLEERLESDFSTWWAANEGTRRFAWVSPQLPHEPWHVPPTCGACPASNLECFAGMGSWLHENVVQTVVDTVDLARTCVLYIADNGAEGQFVTEARGGKFTAWEGGIAVPFFASQACLHGGAPRADGTLAIDLPTIGRFIVEQFGDYAPPATFPSVWYDPRLRGQARREWTEDLEGALAGRCRGTGCGRDGDWAGTYVATATLTIVTDGTYKLAREVPTTFGAAISWQLYALPDEQTDLCAGDCGALVGAPAAAYSKLLARMLEHEAEIPTASTVLELEPPAGDPVAGVPAQFRLWSGDSSLDPFVNPEAEPYPSPIVCDLDFGGAIGQQRVVETRPSRWVWNRPVLVTWPSPGPVTVTGSCFDLHNPANVLEVNLPLVVQ